MIKLSSIVNISKSNKIENQRLSFLDFFKYNIPQANKIIISNNLKIIRFMIFLGVMIRIRYHKKK